MKQKLHQMWRLLVGLSATSFAKTEARPLFLYAERGCKNELQAPVRRADYRLLLLFAVLFSSPAIAQTITGNTSVCVSATVALSTSGSGGSWSSSNTGVATIDPGSGVVTGVSSGTATISYTGSSVSITATMMVNGVLSAGSISGTTAVCIGSTITLTNSMTGGVWSSDNGVISVNPTTGVATGNALGSANILYTVTNSCGSASTGVNVTVNGFTNDIYTFGGTGTSGFSGDGGPAYLAGIGNPRDLFVDTASSSVYFCDQASSTIRKITKSGIITTVAGNVTLSPGNAGDGGPATAASLNAANGVFVDHLGNIFISNTSSHTVRKVNPAGIITTIAGTANVTGSTGDGGPATAATLDFPLGILEDANGDIYVASQFSSNIRKITMSTGIISTVVGSPTEVFGFAGDGGPATNALLHYVRGITMDNSGNIYIADAGNNRIRKYVPSTGLITTFAGTGAATHTGDGGPATAATLTTPSRFAYDGANILYVSDQANNVIRQINLATGIISQVAGNATAGYSGDQGAALSAELNTPAGIAGDHFGNFYIADALNNRIRVVPSTGSLSASILGPDTVCVGTSVSFSAFLSSTGSPSYQWQKNGTNVSGSGPSYTDPSPSNGDVYRCIVTVTPGCSAAFNDTSNNIPVTVNSAASTISAPSSIYAGQSTQLGETVPGGTWSSSSAGVATVSSTGMLYAVAAGSSTITYQLTNVCGTSTVNVSVTVNSPDTILAIPPANGTVSPSGPVVVYGGSQTYYFTPDSGYHITAVIVNGTNVGAVSSYTFSSVSANQTITVTFAPDCVAPAITACPSNVTVSNTTGSCSAAATYTAAIASGSPIITYSQNSGTSFSVGTTTVTVNATNSCGSATCSFNVTVNDNEPPAITAPSNVTLTGYCTSVAASLGTPATSDNCGVASITNNAPSLFPVGTTTVLWTVTDIHGNTATATQTVTVIPATITPSATVTNVTCNGLSNGGISVSATGGAIPYTYSWAGGDGATASVSGLAIGTYSVTITDANSCTASASYTISQPAALTISGSATNVTCYSASTGSITTTVGGGTGGDTYLWNNGATTSGLSNVAAGTYSVTVTDANSCTARTASTITQPAAALAITACPSSVTTNNITGTCAATVTYGTATASGTAPAITYSQNSGTSFPVGVTTVTVNATNACGTATCSFSVTVNDNQAPAITAPANVTVTGQCSSVAASLGTPTTSDNCGVALVTNNAPSLFPIGTTTVLWTVTDIHGNTATATQTVTVVPSTVTASASITNVTCYGLANGRIVASATGGTTPYTYSWSGGEVATATLSGLSIGTYSVSVTDAHGCSAIGNYTITQPAALTISGTATNVNCYSASTGSITTTAGGGTAGYMYTWSNSATTANLSNMAAGTYSVTVADAHSCTANGAYTITQPSAGLAITGTVTNETCNGGASGSVTTSVSGGTSSYTYSWSTGATTSGISGKAAGTYSVTVTDAHSCTAAASYTITQPAATTVSGTITSVGCYGGTTGAVSTSVSGGTSPYTYLWSTGSLTTSSISGKAAGTYTVTVTDAHSCTTTAAFTITQPAQVSSTITGNDSVLGGVASTFTAPVVSSGTYSWSVSGSGVSISGSATESSVSITSPCSVTVYTVNLTVSAGGCSSTSHQTIGVIESATITAYGALYTTSSGYYPSVSKTPLACSLKVYNRHICGPQDGVQSHYSSVWNSTAGQITQCSISAPTCVSYGGGPAYQYTITVPANGHYLVIGQCSIPSSYYGGGSCTLYTGQKAGDYDCVDGSDYSNDYPLTPCVSPEPVYHCALQDNTGRCQEGCIQQQIGSLLLIVSPMSIVFDDSVSSVPVVYESVTGDWSAYVTATPPEGFYATPADSLSTSVSDSSMNAVQFYITDTGSEWTNTELRHTLYHKGATRTVYSHPKMVNNRTNKLAALTIQPNPATNTVQVGFPKFEGKATLSIYNMLGQKMMGQKVSIADGGSVSLDISKLAPGIYLVTAENSAGKVTSRLLKQ